MSFLPQSMGSDDGGLIGESPYFGRTRFKANQRATEGQIQVSGPQRAQLHSVRPMPRSQSPRMDPAAQAALDEQLDKKKREVAASMYYFVVYHFYKT